jgi:hypothetical protein
MKATRTCGECGIPLGVASTMTWNPNGTISQKDDPRHRMIFFECDNLDRLWTRLSELLGVTHEHIWEIVVMSKSRATRAFLYRTLPWYVNFLARMRGYRIMISSIEAQGLVMGYGKITVGGQYPARGRPERITVFVEDPYSLPLFCGDFKGAAEVAERRAASVSQQALDSRRFQVDVTMKGEHMEEESFKVEDGLAYKSGDVEFTPCPTCGTPLELKQFSWDLESGLVKDTVSGRRLAFFGTVSMRAVFDELVRELGERVVEAIIEVERENALEAMSVEEAKGGLEGLRSLAAVRGLGLLTSLDIDASGMNLIMSNPSIPEYIVGLGLGIFELVTGRRGRSEWRIEADGDLVVDITPES